MSAAVGYAGTTCAGVPGGGGPGPASSARGTRRADPAVAVPVPVPVPVVSRTYRKQGMS